MLSVDADGSFSRAILTAHAAMGSVVSGLSI